MKQFLKQYRHVTALMAVCVMSLAISMLGLQAGADLATATGGGFTILALWQLSQFAMSKRCGICFNAVLTPEQVREFESILRGLSSYKDLLPQLETALPEFEERFAKLETHVTEVRRVLVSRNHGTNFTRPKGGVSDECARGLAAAFILHVAKSGKFDDVVRDSRERDSLLSEARSFSRTNKDMSLSEVPLPVVYGTELMELIAEFGVARQEMFSYPMSGGQNRPPRWGTRPQFGAIAMSAQVTEKKPTLEFCDLTSKKLGGIVIMPTEIDTQSLVPMGRFLATYGAVEFARAEDTWAFLADGTATYEGVEGLCKIAEDNDKLVQLASAKTKPSDAVIENFRALRRKVSTAALAGGKYYMNQSWEGALRAYNTVNDKVFDYRPDGTATLDGFPIRWVEVLQPFQDTSAADVPIAVFGRLKFWLFGQRGTPRIDTSEHAYFLYDQIATRFLEELDFDYLSIEAASVLKTGTGS